jgi:hypothetical protein
MMYKISQAIFSEDEGGREWCRQLAVDQSEGPEIRGLALNALSIDPVPADIEIAREILDGKHGRLDPNLSGNSVILLSFGRIEDLEDRWPQFISARSSELRSRGLSLCCGLGSLRLKEGVLDLVQSFWKRRKSQAIFPETRFTLVYVARWFSELVREEQEVVWSQLRRLRPVLDDEDWEQSCIGIMPEVFSQEVDEFLNSSPNLERVRELATQTQWTVVVSWRAVFEEGDPKTLT